MHPSLDRIKIALREVKDVLADYRRQRGRIDRDNLTEHERATALEALHDDMSARLRGIADASLKARKELDDAADQVEGRHPAPDADAVRDAWGQAERLLDAGVGYVEILERHGASRAMTAALTTNLPGYLEARAGAAAGGGSRGSQAARSRSVQDGVRVALRAVADHELTIVEEPLRTARLARREADTYDVAIDAHLDGVAREVTGGRRISPQEAMTMGLTDPEPAERREPQPSDALPMWKVTAQAAQARRQEAMGDRAMPDPTPEGDAAVARAFGRG